MNPLVLPFGPSAPPPLADDPTGMEDPTSPYVTREWLVTNGLGGYASGTVGGMATRRYHGVLIAALPAPLGRTMTLAHVAEILRMPDGRAVQLGVQAGPLREGIALPSAALVEFRLESGLPVWKWDVLGVIVERRVWMPHRENTVHVAYRAVSGVGAVHLELEPWVRFRPHDGPLDAEAEEPHALTVTGDRYEVASKGYPPLRLSVDREASAFTIDRKRMREVKYQVERTRGYDSVGELHSPGYFRSTLTPGDAGGGSAMTLTASTEAWQRIRATPPDQAHAAEYDRRTRLIAAAHPSSRDGLASQLVLAADQFLIAPAARTGGDGQELALDDEARTVIAGYHWFTDWGRDTMISLEGLTLVTGRAGEARNILLTFAEYVRDGLIPNMFPEHGREGLYHTADATLWFFHAIDRYIEYTGDRQTLERLLPKLVDIVDRHIEGTRFGIGMDPRDSLMSQGAVGYALTWMDAKVGDLVVTPRRGKAVEINALWYNALRLLADWLEETGSIDPSRRLGELADNVCASFNRRFWYDEGAYLFDLVEGEHGDDSSFRPNQILAVSLRHPVLDPSRWPRVVGEVRKRLATPVGLRSLSAGHPDFKAKYFGDLRARDLAYHQGTVWAWLIGPLVDASLRVDGDIAAARELLAGFSAHIGEAGIGSISEIFDAEPPFVPRGCIAQAWSVAEVLRCLVKTSASGKLT